MQSDQEEIEIQAQVNQPEGKKKHADCGIVSLDALIKLLKAHPNTKNA